MILSPQRLLLPLGAILMASCTAVRENPVAIASCCSPLPLEKIAGDLGFQIEYLGMHQYHFFNDKYEFDLLASSGMIALVDETDDDSSTFSPVWTLGGNVSEDTLKAKIRRYLYGNQPNKSVESTGASR